MKSSLIDSNPQLCMEWDFKKNRNLTPKMVTAGSSKKVWWKCHTCGYEWCARIDHRTREKSGCPACAGKAVYVGHNDLETVNSYLSQEWNYERNQDLTPRMVTFSSGKKVWWKCSKCGYEWTSTVASRSRGRGCPACAGKTAYAGYNDLATAKPSLVIDWNYKKNGNLTPEMVTAGSDKKVWWKCHVCGYEWQSEISSRVNGIGCPACSNKKVWPGHNDLATLRPDISCDWDYAKNEGLLPSGIVPGSNKRIWWKCSKCGYEWAARCNDRTKENGTGCAMCAGQIIVPGVNDLATTSPTIVKEWDYDKNLSLTPDHVFPHSNKKVWWKCEKGHSYYTSPSNRIRGRGCPICSGNIVVAGINDLATTNQQLSEEWDYSKNGSLTPQGVTAGSPRKVWWKCHACGYEWEATIGSRKRGSGCPACSNKKVWPGHNDLVTVNPSLSQEWDNEKNGTLMPSMVTVGTQKKVWWKCSKCGYEWTSTVASRSRGRGCPACVGKAVYTGHNDLATINPFLASEWNYEKNGTLTPQMVTAGSTKKIWWKCSKCGNEWLSTINNRVYGNGCPTCNFINKTSVPEQTVFYYVSKVFSDTIGNYKPKWLKKSEIDIYIPEIKVGIEYDGMQWHKNKDKDINKVRLAKQYGVDIIRIREDGCPDLEIPYVIKTKRPTADLMHMVPALHQLFDILVKIKPSISIPDINIDRDLGDIISSFSRIQALKSLATVHPELIAEWHPTLNGALTPEMVFSVSSRFVWWKCSKCGFEWRSSVQNRTNMHSGCPACAGKTAYVGYNDLATVNPSLSQEWNYEKNGTLTPQMVTAGSGKKVWWKCHVCGYEWESLISNRSKGQGCPICGQKKRAEAKKKRVRCIEKDLIFDSITSASHSEKIGIGSLGNCLAGRSETAGGYHWEYVDNVVTEL